MMSNGLDRMLASIVDDGEQKAAEILKKAQDEADALRQKYQKEAEQTTASMMAQCEKEGRAYIATAASAVEMKKRNMMLEAEGKMMDAVFQNSLNAVRQMDENEYVETLAVLLTSTFKKQVEVEQKDLVLYGDEAEIPEKYEVIFNPEDTAKCAKLVLAKAKAKLTGAVPNERLNKLTLSDETRPIFAGFVLHYGDIESNVDIARMFDGLRERYAVDVAHILFDEERPK